MSTMKTQTTKSPDQNDVSKAKEAQSNDPFQQTLIITPKKMVIPSSGYLEVTIKNPTHVPVHLGCTVKSFSFDVERAWYIENGKEVEAFLGWSGNSESDYINRYETLTGCKGLSHEMKPGEVFYIRIKNEDNFDGPEIRLLYEKPIDKMTIFTNVNFPLVFPDAKTPGQAKFDLDVHYFFPMIGDPEKMKEVNQKFAEYQKKRERLKRLRGIKIKEDETPEDLFSEYGEHYEDDAERFVSRREKRNERLLKKYGTKVDQLTEEEIKKIKEGIKIELDEEWKRNQEEKEKKYQEEQEKIQEEQEKSNNEQEKMNNGKEKLNKEKEKMNNKQEKINNEKEKLNNEKAKIKKEKIVKKKKKKKFGFF